MSRSIYYRVQQYARTLDPVIYKDLVHDTWLHNYTRDGTNLLDKPIFLIFKAVKLVYLNRIKSNYWHWRGEKGYKDFRDCTDELHEQSDPNRLQDDKTSSNMVIEDLFTRITKDKSKFHKQKLKDITIMFSDGYNVSDVADKLHLSDRLVRYYRTKLGELIA